MPALNVMFSAEEMDALRVAAARADTSLKAFVHDAVAAALSDHKRRVREAAVIVAARSGELNRRLA
jgi:hypothetical protein